MKEYTLLFTLYSLPLPPGAADLCDSKNPVDASTSVTANDATVTTTINSIGPTCVCVCV